MSISELKKLKEFNSHQTFKRTNWNSRWNIMEFKELTKRIDQWITNQEKKNKKKEHYLENLDLGKDKIWEYKNIILQKNIIRLKEIGYNEEEANALVAAAIKRFEKELSNMPEHYNSNHMYKNIAEIQSSPIELVDYATWRKTIFYDEFINIFQKNEY